MADNKKYYYLKLKEDFFESEEMLMLQEMKDGYLYSDILLKMYLRSLKCEGKLMYRNYIPYSASAIATLCRHQVGTVEKALDVLKGLGLIEILDNGAIYMMDIQNFIGSSSTEADRQRMYYNRIKNEKTAKLEDKAQKKEQKEIPEKPVEHKNEQKPKKETTVQIFERLYPEYNISPRIVGKLVEWFAYKMERREPYKEQGMKSFLRQMENKSMKYSEDSIVELIDDCMANSWKGIIWDILEKKNNQPTGGDRIQKRVSEVDNW